MKKKKTKTLLSIFILLNIFDLIITLAVKIKQPYFNETNPIYIATGTLWSLFFLKAIAIIIMYLLLMYAYQKVPITARYFFVSVVVIGIIGLVMVLPGNINEYWKEPSEVVDIPVEDRAQQYNEGILNPIISMYAVLIAIFIVWNNIEGEQIGKNRR